jgi:hypothetical protein
MATLVAPTPKPAKPPEPILDELAAEYVRLKREILEENLELLAKIKPKADRCAALGRFLTDACHTYGAPHEMKSKRLTGMEYEVVTDQAASVSLDQAAVQLFESRCSARGDEELFAQLFEITWEYKLLPGADAIARTNLPYLLAASFRRCTVTQFAMPALAAVRKRIKGAA